MNADKIQELVAKMNPEEAASSLATVLKEQLSYLEEDAKIKVISTLIGEFSDEKVTSLVHL